MEKYKYNHPTSYTKKKRAMVFYKIRQLKTSKYVNGTGNITIYEAWGLTIPSSMSKYWQDAQALKKAATA
jgi:hypothetical protein